MPIPEKKGEKMKIKVGDFVRTVKGDQHNPESKTWKLQVLELKSGWKGLHSAICLKPDGRKSAFLLKNLVRF